MLLTKHMVRGYRGTGSDRVVDPAALFTDAQRKRPDNIVGNTSVTAAAYVLTFQSCVQLILLPAARLAHSSTN